MSKRHKIAKRHRHTANRVWRSALDEPKKRDVSFAKWIFPVIQNMGALASVLDSITGIQPMQGAE